MKLRTFRYFFREAWRGIVRNRLMSLTAMGTIAIALILFGVFSLFTTNLQYFSGLALGRIEIRAFLSESARNFELLKAEIQAIPGVQRVEFVSKEEAARWLEKALGNKGLFLGGENPLPNSFNVYPARGTNVENIAGQVRRVAGVDEVVYGREFVRHLHIIVRLIWVIGFGLLFLVMLAVLYIVVNTIQMTIYARRKEIEIMKLVGATDWFVRWPFMLEGIMLGLGGALVAVIIVLEAYSFLHNRLGRLSTVLSLLTRAEITPYIIGGFFGVGIIFGAVGSLLSVKRHLSI
ncbi:MAG: ABC transporter permease [Clostridia bacterium]|nr:ABC transporter permease [Clostridia bacterium]